MQIDICRSAIKTQILLNHAINFNLFSDAEQLKEIDLELKNLFDSSKYFDFVGQLKIGSCLLVGEGNMSFARSLMKFHRIDYNNLTISVFESEEDLSDESKNNQEWILENSGTILHSVDATALINYFPNQTFKTIVFQFPHTGNRDSVEGHNSNFILVRDFLFSAKEILAEDGVILISAINSPYYNGAFKFEEAAKIAGFVAPISYDFDMMDFPNYVHTKTKEEESAIDKNDELKTWVFRR